MAHNDPMTWRPKERRWSKWYRGKFKNVSFRQLVKAGLADADAPNTKEATRTAMREWWKRTQAQVDSEARESERTKRPPKGIYLSGVRVDYSEDGTARNKMSLHIASKIDAPDGGIEEHVKTILSNGQRQLERFHAHEADPDKAISTNIEVFLAFKRSQAEAGERSLDRADALRVHLNDHLARWIGESTPVSDLGEATIRQYYEHVLGSAKKGTISRYYARDLFASFRQFVRWLAHQRLIAMPLNVNSREFSFKLRVKPRTFPDNEVTLLLKEASERTRLYLLLMLNCGFTQIDIAELGKTRVNLKNRKITHKRFKTEDQPNVPTVTYPLWPETCELLRHHLNDREDITNRHGESLALVSQEGKPLLVKKYDSKGRLKKTDAIRSAYSRVVTKLRNREIAISGTLKHFRKTASTKLEEHATYGRYVVHFLGQSPETLAGKHYVTPSQKQFDEAIAWLRIQFGLSSD